MTECTCSSGFQSGICDYCINLYKEQYEPKEKIMDKKYYGETEQERLDTDPEDVVSSVFDSYEAVAEYEYPFIVHIFKRQKVDIDGDYVLERILENLDDDHADPDGDYTKPTEKMKIAVEKLIEVIKSEYRSFMCETTGEKIEYSQKDVLEIVGFSE